MHLKSLNEYFPLYIYLNISLSVHMGYVVYSHSHQRVIRLSGDVFLSWHCVNPPIFVSGLPPVLIRHLQDGVLFILPQLQVLGCHGCVTILCYDSHAYGAGRLLRRLWR